MKILKIFLLIVVVLVGLFFAEMKFGFLPDKYRQIMDNSIGKIFGADSENITQIVNSANLDPEAINTLKERSEEVTGQVQGVFSQAIEPSSAEKPLHDRALEYGRYLYCNEVVKSYEQQRNVSPEEN